MFFVGYIAAPPTILVCAKVFGANAIAAKAKAEMINFFILFL